MSDQPIFDSSHKSTQKSVGENATTVDKDGRPQRHDPTIQHHSPTGKPGENVSGRDPDPSVPPSHDDADNVHHGMLASAQHAIHNATETIRHFLPGSSPESTSQPIREPHGSSGHSTSENMKQSMPGSLNTTPSGEAVPKDSPLPSKEIPGGSRIGVGSLPGHLSEVSVAKLPEERRQENLPSHETDHEQLGKTGGVGPLPGGPSESGVALLPEERAHPVDESQPKTEDVKDVPSRSMAGDEAVPQERPAASVKKLPEVLRQEAVPSTGESAVAALPQDDVVRDEESDKPKNTASDESQSQTGPVPTSYDQPVRQGSQHDDSPAVPPGLGGSSLSSAQGHTESETVDPTTTNKLTEAAPGVDEKSEGVHLGREMAGEPRSHVGGKRRSKSASKQSAQDSSDSRGTSHSTPHSDDPANSVSEDSPPKLAQTAPMTASRKHRASTGSAPTNKVGFMDRMKGEAMIISGKLGKNEKKVEEGKSLMGK